MSDTPIGTLIVVVLKARNLNDKHSFYKQDVFAQVSLNDTSKRTHVDVKGGQHPAWDEELRFLVTRNAATKYRNLEVSCFAKEPRSDDLLGKGVVDISETLRTGEFDDWVSLDVNGVSRGEVYLEMTYYASAASAANKLSVSSNVGLNRRPSKLAPSDRLSRPSAQSPPHPISPLSNQPAASKLKPQGRTTHQFHNTGSVNSPTLQASPPRPHSDPTFNVPELPQLPEVQQAHVSVPSSLTPGTKGSQAQKKQTPAPDILRPGIPNVSFTQIPHIQSDHMRSASASASNPTTFGHPSNHHPLPYGTNSNTSIPTSPQRSPVPLAYINAPYVLPANDPIPYRTMDNASAAPLSFPVPAISPVRETFEQNTLYHNPGPGSYTPPQHNLIDRTDPYLKTRYQSPLPLPPDAASKSPPLGLQTLPKESNVDEYRIQKLRSVEEEAKLRRLQEEKDRELAFKLDRELNLAE